jgi:hypothetical protein
MQNHFHRRSRKILLDFGPHSKLGFPSLLYSARRRDRRGRSYVQFSETVMRALSGALLSLVFLHGCTSIPAGPSGGPTAPTSNTIPDGPALETEAPVIDRRPPKHTRARAKPALEVQAEDSRTPDVGSPEWERAQTEDQEKERRLNRTIRSICRGC